MPCWGPCSVWSGCRVQRGWLGLEENRIQWDCERLRPPPPLLLPQGARGGGPRCGLRRPLPQIHFSLYVLFVNKGLSMKSETLDHIYIFKYW